jgi:hypothetical protein
MLNLLAALAITIGLFQTHGHGSDPADVAGTWNISLSGHQIGLVLEQTDTAISGTLMLMGTDVALTGTFVDGVLKVSGKADNDSSGHLSGEVTIEARLNGDGTLSGELSTPRGKAVFSNAERLKRRRG